VDLLNRNIITQEKPERQPLGKKIGAKKSILDRFKSKKLSF
jgi:hypothetical protein